MINKKLTFYLLRRAYINSDIISQPSMDNTIEVTENNNPPQEKIFYNIADPIILYLSESKTGGIFFAMLWFFHILLHLGSLFAYAAILDNISVYPIEKIKKLIIGWGIITVINFFHLLDYRWKIPGLPKSPGDNVSRISIDIINLCMDIATMFITIGSIVVTFPLFFQSFEMFLLLFIISSIMLFFKQFSFFFLRLTWMKKVRII